MKYPRSTSRPPLLAALLTIALLEGCASQPGPVAVAIDYGHALYVGEAHAIYRLISAKDQRVKSEVDFAHQQQTHAGALRRDVRPGPIVAADGLHDTLPQR